MTAHEVDYRAHERVEIRTARSKHHCWTFLDGYPAPGEGYDGGPPCAGVIREGERYVVSTIYPGHDSGYADGGWDSRGRAVPPRPVSSSMCMPCAERWRNTSDALNRIAARLGPVAA